NLPDTLPTGIYADEKRLRQVLLNLLGNAIKFTERGSVIFSVDVCLSPDDNSSLQHSRGATHLHHPATMSLRFKVEDSGIGLSTEQIDQIFLPFEQVAETIRKIEGTGLGLAISQQIVNLMGSEIQVNSISNQGSSFWFDIELLVVEKVTNTFHQTILGMISMAGKPLEKPPTILVIDTREEDRLLLKEMLTPLGFNVIEDDGTMQADYFSAHTEQALSYHLPQLAIPQLAIVDMSRPGNSGYQSISTIRHHPQAKEIAVIATSARVFESDAQDYLAAGANIFLPKPIELDTLLSAIAQQLNITWQYAPSHKASDHGKSPCPTVSPKTNPTLEASKLVLAEHPHSHLKADLKGLAQDLYTPAFWFVAGISAAAVSSLFGYLNYQRLAVGAFDSARIEASGHQAQHNPVQYISHKSFYDEKSVEAHDDFKSTGNWAKWTAWIALIFAIGSFVSFVAGCYWTGEALLLPLKT
ncbi:MAG: ATP-binding protein, partial [Pseudomonadota bacterium]